MSGDWQRESTMPRERSNEFTQQRQKRIIIKRTKQIVFLYTVMDGIVKAILRTVSVFLIVVF